MLANLTNFQKLDDREILTFFFFAWHTLHYEKYFINEYNVHHAADINLKLFAFVVLML